MARPLREELFFAASLSDLILTFRYGLILYVGKMLFSYQYDAGVSAGP